MNISSSSIARWRLARSLTLGAIVFGGSLATAITVSHRLGAVPCARSHQQHHVPVTRTHTYSGIGVAIVLDGDDVVIHETFRGYPADGVLAPNSKLLSVNGETPLTMRDWSDQIQGEAGTEVHLEIDHPTAGRQSVTLRRELVHLRERGR